jgi:hypothetical protein
VAEEIIQRIRRLVEGMNKLELEIVSATDALKEYYVKVSAAMPDDKTYFLSGLQTESVVKPYLLTRRGIDVPGEETRQIPEFIESVLRFASDPKRKIEVLSNLSNHLQNIYTMIQKEGTW